MAEPVKRLFTVSEYHSLADAGILTEDDRVELIEGEIFQMAAIGNRHAGCVKRLNRLLSRALADRVLLGIQDPIEVDDYSEPEPDISILHPRADDYSSSHPSPKEIFLVIEVADSSARFDRLKKIPVYARNGILEAWLVDLTTDRVEMYREPSAMGYRQVQQLRAGDRISPLAFPDLVLEVGEILV
ncbi:MAG TPA: Uma2 family endonuclease [Thermoanaerobaculia bacterium]|jgi:Uma2 family endonuclease|nr:Uma2 family endonuclease [Thermoanaerobaculia bacterium]